MTHQTKPIRKKSRITQAQADAAVRKYLAGSGLNRQPRPRRTNAARPSK